MLKKKSKLSCAAQSCPSIIQNKSSTFAAARIVHLQLWLCCSRAPFSSQHQCPDPLELYYIIPFWHLLSNFNEMTQANKLSLNFPSLCPLVSSFINWTANVVLIFPFLQLNLKWPSLLVVYGLELLFLDISIPRMTSLLFFFLSSGDEWTRHSIPRHPRPRQWRHRLQVSGGGGEISLEICPPPKKKFKFHSVSGCRWGLAALQGKKKLI